MKSVGFLLCTTLLLTSCASKTALNIPPGQCVEIDYPQYEAYSASLKSKKGGGVEVSVRSKSNDGQIRGFGLGPAGKSVVGVENTNKLVLVNTSDRPARVLVEVTESEAQRWAPPQNSIGITLQNKSSKAIPLIIPGVMNPNLSPMSKSGVNLAVGQEILFRYKGKNQVLLMVDASISEGDVIDVAALLKERKAALD